MHLTSLLKTLHKLSVLREILRLHGRGPDEAQELIDKIQSCSRKLEADAQSVQALCDRVTSDIVNGQIFTALQLRSITDESRSKSVGLRVLAAAVAGETSVSMHSLTPDQVSELRSKGFTVTAVNEVHHVVW